MGSHRFEQGTVHVRRGVAAAAATALAFALWGSSASAQGSKVTAGDFSAFAAGQGMNISGRATMIRTADGKTIVSIHLEGLQPVTTYASHVHATACDDNLADGHYKFDALGPGSPPNEIWPGPFTTTSSGVGNGYSKAEGTAGPEAVSVVVHDPTGAKVACADLI